MSVSLSIKRYLSLPFIKQGQARQVVEITNYDDNNHPPGVPAHPRVLVKVEVYGTKPECIDVLQRALRVLNDGN